VYNAATPKQPRITPVNLFLVHETETAMPQVDRHVVGTPNWFDLMTPDGEKARAFYSKLFGWDFNVGGAEMGGYSMCLKNGQPVAGMGPMPENAPFPTAWSVYFETANVDASVEAVKANGGQVTMPPMDVMEEGRMAVCTDPTGATFGFWQGNKHTGAKIVSEPGAMAWSEVYTRDGVKASAFYQAVMGLKAVKMEGMEYWTLDHGAQQHHCGVMTMDKDWPENIPPHWRPYFAVNQTDASCEIIKNNGGKVLMGPFDTPHGRMAAVEDPFGATFSIISGIPSK
jgi:predicted enzyme related to lactoylglutathione lyase